jgi:hypothetical protein
MMDELQKEKLKSQALLGRVADITTMYEGAMADSRVAVTVLAEENDALRKENEELKAEKEVKSVAKGATEKTKS